MAARKARTKYERRARTMAVVMGSVLVLATVGGAIATLTSSSGSSSSAPTTAAQVVDAEGEQLLALLRTGLGGTFHAEYTITQTDGTLVASEVLDHDAGRIREVLSTPASAGSDLLARIFDAATAVECQQPAGSDWTCRDLPAGTLRQDTLFSKVTRAGLLGVDVTATPADIGDRTGTCFTYDDAAAGPTTVCLDAGGVPLRFTVTTLDIELVTLTATVDPSVFAPPAPPSS